MNAKKHLATIIGEHQPEDFKNRIILLLYSQVSNRSPPMFINFRRIFHPGHFYPTLRLLNFEKYSSQESVNLDSNKKPFQYFSQSFMSHIIFRSNFWSHFVVVSNWIKSRLWFVVSKEMDKNRDCDLLYQKKWILFV